MNFATWMQQIQQRTEQALEQRLPSEHIAPGQLHAAMRYATLDGGKRVRPLLCHGTGEIFGVAPELLDYPACAVEMIHAYSLVHDDMPCMDDDTLRRGKPTCHVAYDEATALLVGDALQSQAFAVLGDAPVESATALKMLRLLSLASGSRGMAGGQAIDLAATGREQSLEALEFMHLHKTGALIRAAVLLGAYCGTTNEDEIAALTRFANQVGLLFQVVDDVLDSEANTATLGKTAGKDAAQNKSTYVSLLGLARAKEKAEELRANAHQALAAFGPRAAHLAALTDFIVDRRY